MKRHPFGKVPVISFPDGLTLYESRAICKFLTRKYSFPLLPSETNLEDMARFDQAQSVETSYFAEPAGKIAFEKFAKKFMGLPADEAAVAGALQSLGAYFDVAESLLEHQNFMAGKDFSLVDISYIPLIQRLFMCGYGDMVRNRKALSAWWDRCVNREAIQKMITADKEAMAAARV